MRYFEVEAEYIGGENYRYPVNADGTKGGEKYDVDGDPNDRPVRVLIGYLVIEYDENGYTKDCEFYEVETDFAGVEQGEFGAEFTSNKDHVLQVIKDEHDPSEWQNNMW